MRQGGINAADNGTSAYSVPWDGQYYGWRRSKKYYELTNHLGNVVITLSDSKPGVKQTSNSSLIDHYTALKITETDFYPFGMQMQERTSSTFTANYRYGFNGKEQDDEVKGVGNQIDYGARVYDPRIGRFLSVDPLSKHYAWYTPYQFSGNGPIANLDKDGEEEYHYTITLSSQGKTYLTQGKTEEYNHHSIFGWKLPDTKIAKERYVVTFAENTYYIGFASNPGRNNNWKVALFKQFLKEPDAQVFVNTFDDSKTENRNAFISDMQIAAVSSLMVYDHLSTTIRNSKRSLPEPTKENNATVYRTQGGLMPNASQERIQIGSHGSITVEGDEMLHITLNDKQHAVYFYEKRGGSGNGASIISFKIPQSLADEIKDQAVPQAQGKAFPESPQIDDPTKSTGAFGLPKKYIEKLRQQAIQGSGSVQKP